MPRRRRRRPLQGSQTEHAERVQRFFRRAAESYDRAQRTNGCHDRLERLFEAHGNLARAYESFDAGGELLVSTKTVSEMRHLNSKIRAAADAIADGACTRSRAAR